MPLVIGLDVGTGSTKALIYDTERREVVGRGAASYGVSSPKPGWAEQDPDTWTDAVAGSVSAALDGLDASRVKALAVSGQQHGLVALDEGGRPLCPAALWCDVRCYPQARRLAEALGDPAVVPATTAAKLLWLREEMPDMYGRLRHALLPHDYVNYYLTGEFRTEASDASGTGLLREDGSGWDETKVAEVDPGLVEALPRLVGPGEHIGRLTASSLARLGLPTGAEVVVGPGGGDNAMSALGAGAVDPGEVLVSLGTSGTVFGPTEAPLDPRTAPSTVCRFRDCTGRAMPLVCTLNCAGAVEETRRALGLSAERAAELAGLEPPGSRGVTFLPYLRGERTPNWPDATGALLNLRPDSLRPGAIYRAALEGVVFSLLEGVDRLREAGLPEPRRLLAVGGLTRSELARRILADASGIPVAFPVEADAAALGAALQAAAVLAGSPVADYVRAHPPPIEARVLEPVPDAHAAYRAARERHRNEGLRLFGGGGGGGA